MEESLNSYIQEYSTDHMDHHHQEDDTLSLSDLPIYGSESVDHEDSRVDDQALDDEDFPKGGGGVDDQAFEFFSGEWSSTTTTATSSFPSTTTTTLDPNVVFCGKIIPYKLESTTPAKYQNTHVPELIAKKRRKRRYITLSWWNSVSTLSKSRSSVKSTDSTSQRYLYEGEKEVDGKTINEIQVSKVPIVVAPTKSSKWYLYVFGLSRVPTKMHVGDLRRRHGSSTSLRSSGSVSASLDHKFSSKSEGDASGKGLGWWTLIKVLGCGGGDGVDHHATAVVTATHGLSTGVSV